MSLPPNLGPPSDPSTVTSPWEAFGELYTVYFDPIYWYCRGRLGDAQAAEDAASLVFINAFVAGPRYDDPALRSWLFCIAHNVVVNAIRANRPDRIASKLELAIDIADDAALPDEAAIAEEERRALRVALNCLPDDQRRVVELRMMGMTGPEIATYLGRSHPAVKMLQLRAFARLRDLLTATPGGEVRRHDG